MKRTGLLSRFPATAILFICTLLFLAAAAPTASAESTVTPILVVDTASLCFGETLTDTISVPLSLPINDTADIIQTDGPGSFQLQPGDSLFGYYTLTPDTAGVYEATFQVIEPDSSFYSIMYRYVISLNLPPTGDDMYLSAFLCGGGAGRYLMINASDPENDPLTYTLLSGIGSIDSETGELSYWPPTAGVYEHLVEVADQCGADTVLISDTVTINALPEFSGYDTTIALCAPEEICLPLSATDADGDVLEFRRLDTSSVGTLNQLTSTTAEICFTPDGETTEYEFVVCVVDTCNLRASQAAMNYTCVEDTIRVSITTNQPPVGDDMYLSTFQCFPGDGRYLTVTASDPDNDPLTFTLLSGIGTIDPETGELSYYPVEAGVYEHLIEVADECAADTIFISDTISINALPEFTGYDTTVTLCAPEEICLPFSATDADGDILEFRRLDTLSTGTLTQLTNNTGQICFTPTGDASQTYSFVVCVVDTCNLRASEAAANYTCVEDTINVTVNINQPPVIVCPDPQNFYTCAVDTFCFTLDVNDPEFGPVNYSILSGNAWLHGDTVCVEGGEDAQFDVIIAATDTCGLADTCTVPVTIQGNRAPVATLGDDFSMLLCGPQTLCIDASADDVDFDLDTAYSNIGTYDPQNTSVCFTADTAGVYEIILTAIDSCGAMDEDTAYVTVGISAPPVVDLGEDLAVNLCGAEQICIEPTITVDSLMSVMTWPAEIYDAETGQICFTADTAGSYRIIMKVEDYCGKSDTDTMFVNVMMGGDLSLDLGPDLSLAQCEPSEICIPVTGTLVNTNFSWSFGQFNSETDEICFTPDTSGIYKIVASVTDSCGGTIEDTVNVAVTVNRAPVMSALKDTTLYLCFPTEICLPIEASDPDGDPLTIMVNRGTYKDGSVCFVPYDSGTYRFIVTATDTCGESVVDTANVTIKTDQGVDIICPGDTSLFTCGADTFSVPIEIINRPVGSQVIVKGISSWWDEQSQSVKFTAECSNTNKITVTVKTPCGEKSCTFTATVECNSAPVVILPQDTTVALCTPDQEYCFPVGISDVDDNLDSVHVDGGTYNEANGTVCFTPGAEGSYTVTVTAYDTCGAVDSDAITVNVIGNTAPTVDLVIPDGTVNLCDLEPFCVVVEARDTENNIVDIKTNIGTLDSTGRVVCVVPDTSGDYLVRVIVTDECGLSDTAYGGVSVQRLDYVIYCPPPVVTADTLCTAGEVCVDLYSTGFDYTVSSNIGSWANNKLCFMADTAGTYSVTVIAESQCTADTCNFDVIVPISPTATVTCPNDTTVFVCGPDTVFFDITTTGANSVGVSGGYLVNNQVAVPVLTEGSKTVTLVAVGDCGNDTCSFVVTSDFNEPPVIIATDSSLNACELSEICVPFTVSDPDENFDSVSTTIGTVVDNKVCFTPDNFGTTRVILTAWDSCVAKDVDTASVTVVAGGVAAILCPANTIEEMICGPDTVCVTVPISPSNATVTVTPRGYYDNEKGTICIPVEQTETINVTVVADAACGSDTCSFQVDVTALEPAAISCPETIDTLLCLAEPTQFCYPVTIAGTNPVVTVSPIGTVSNNQLCLPIDTAGSYDIRIIAANECAVDTCMTTINVTADQAPEITLPDGLVFERCADDTNTVCVSGIDVYDAEGDESLTMISGSGSFDLSGEDQLCFVPDSVGPHYFVFQADDGCNVVNDTLVVDFIERPDCDVCVRITIDVTDPVPVGQEVQVPILVETNDPIGGFDLLIQYDASVMTFLNASIDGSDIDAWEYFTYSTGSAGCGGACPSGIVRLVGIADVNNGSFHPPLESLSPQGTLAFMNFRVANDQTLGDQFLPISFVWFECRDNSISDPTGNKLYLDLRIYSPEGDLRWDEDDNVGFPESSRPFGTGTPDACIADSKNPPTRCVEFYDGGIKIVHPDSIDLRGDINLNSFPYEIADAVLYSNYFVRGMSVFIINPAGQIAASDVNNDGYTLSVADLVLMIRIIIGDAEPIPKTTGAAQEISIVEAESAGGMSVRSKTESDIGGAWIVYDLPAGTRIDDVTAGEDASQMTVDHSIVNNQLRVLLYNIGTGSIEPGDRELINIDYSGAAPVLDTAEFADYYGHALSVNSSGPIVPSRFSLAQNYPNPFNPSTTISFELPSHEQWNLKIFSVTGVLVREFSGADAAGEVKVVWDGHNGAGDQVASGVYFYRLEVADFSDTRKMVLLK